MRYYGHDWKWVISLQFMAILRGIMMIGQWMEWVQITPFPTRISARKIYFLHSHRSTTKKVMSPTGYPQFQWAIIIPPHPPRLSQGNHQRLHGVAEIIRLLYQISMWLWFQATLELLKPQTFLNGWVLLGKWTVEKLKSWISQQMLWQTLQMFDSILGFCVQGVICLVKKGGRNWHLLLERALRCFKTFYCIVFI